MHPKMFIISFFLLAALTLSPSQGQCENWKEFFKDGDTIWQYDRDSIHYPQQKKILGLTVRNKDIVNIWIRWIDKKYRGPAFIERIYCVERELGNPFNLNLRDEPIKPGSQEESLLKKICP